MVSLLMIIGFSNMYIPEADIFPSPPAITKTSIFPGVSLGIAVKKAVERLERLKETARHSTNLASILTVHYSGTDCFYWTIV